MPTFIRGVSSLSLFAAIALSLGCYQNNRNDRGNGPAPYITSTTPQDGDSNVAVNVVISMRWNVAVDMGANSFSVTMNNSSSNQPGYLYASSDKYTYYFVSDYLYASYTRQFCTAYNVQAVGGSDVSQNISWSFMTGSTRQSSASGAQATADTAMSASTGETKEETVATAAPAQSPGEPQCAFRRMKVEELLRELPNLRLVCHIDGPVPEHAMQK